MTKNIIISVDAGGTSTTYVVYDLNKQVLKKYKGGIGSPCVDVNACNNIKKKLEEIVKDFSSFSISCICIGMSGYALVDHDAFVNEIENSFNTKCIFVNDAILALYSVIKDKYNKGLVVISGTGAIILAVNDSETFIANGWGELLTERGSGYATVRDFVCKMIHHMEENGKLSDFENKFLQYCGCKELEDFKMLIYRHGKNEVAKYSFFFLDEAKQNNALAINWLYENGLNMGQDCVNALNRVNMNDEFILGFRGGYINPYMIKGIKEKLDNVNFKYIIDEETDPVEGGFYLAKKEK